MSGQDYHLTDEGRAAFAARWPELYEDRETATTETASILSSPRPTVDGQGFVIEVMLCRETWRSAAERRAGRPSRDYTETSKVVRVPPEWVAAGQARYSFGAFSRVFG